jgi:hypothetical protein
MLGVSQASEKIVQKPLVTENLVRYIRRFTAGDLASRNSGKTAKTVGCGRRNRSRFAADSSAHAGSAAATLVVAATDL